MQNTSIRIIFVLYTYCILIFFYVMCVCTIFHDTVYKRSILNAAEKKCLTLCEHFTIKSFIWTSCRCPRRLHLVIWVRFCTVAVECDARLTAARGGPADGGKTESRAMAASGDLTSHWRPAYSARARRAAAACSENTFDSERLMGEMTSSSWVSTEATRLCDQNPRTTSSSSYSSVIPSERVRYT